RIHTGGGEGTLDAQLVLAGLDVIGDLLQGLEVGDVLGGVAGLFQQRLVVDDAVGLNDVGNGGNAVAVLQCEGVAGQVGVQFGAGQVVAVILPVGQTDGAVDLEQGGSV